LGLVTRILLRDEVSVVKVMTWNIRGYTGATKDRQLEAVVDLGADIVALQEVVDGSLGFWRTSLKANGYAVVNSAVELLDVPGPILPHTGQRFGKRRNLNLIASREPLEKLAGLSLPKSAEGFPEKYLVARTVVEGRSVEIHNAHTPPGSTVKMLKVEFWESMLERLDQPTDAARILCGDFNSPWSETEAGFEVGGGRSDPAEEARWVEAELGFLQHPELRDVYRSSRERGLPFAHSHRRGRGENQTPCRYDHVYVSERHFDLARSECVYREDLLAAGLSDHAPVVATLRVR
jgi:endonuclease/exonuclease/phosphatase family metal-dependent hydrolase